MIATSAATAGTADATKAAPWIKIGAPALLLSTVGGAEPELPEGEEDVAVTVSFEDVVDELSTALAELVCEGLTDAVPLLTIGVVTIPVVLAGEDDAPDGPAISPVTAPTE